MRYFKFFVPVLALSLLGAGCLGIGGGTSTADGGVWKTSDAGLSWTQSVAIPTATGVGSLADTSILDFVIDPEDHLALYIATISNGMLFSYDGGVSWQQPRETALRSGQVNSLAIDSKDKCTVYAVLTNQLAKSTDCSRTFNTEVYVESRPRVTLTDVLVDWYDSNVIWLSTSEGDVIKSTNGGVNWITSARLDSKIVQMLIDNIDSRIVYVATERKGLYKTTDAGENWVDMSEGLKGYSDASHLVSITQDAKSSVLLINSEYGLLRSTDKGSTWQALELITAPKEVDILVLAVDPNDTDRIYYATASTFYSTIDAGVNWQTRKLPTLRTPTSLAIDFEDGNVIYLGGAKFE
ncbi:MAG: hypothetical protein V1695_04085 [Candidatus Uhrbacteria bacterium]